MGVNDEVELEAHIALTLRVASSAKSDHAQGAVATRTTQHLNLPLTSPLLPPDSAAKVEVE